MCRKLVLLGMMTMEFNQMIGGFAHIGVKVYIFIAIQ